MIWFTSDLHFFHDRILEFHPKRKELFGDTVEKAKEAMIQLWNSRVNKKDTVIKNIKFKKSVYNFLYKDLEVIMCHFPMLSWEHKDKGSVMIHGHCHGKVDQINIDSKELRVDVGIDGNLANYDLISLEKLSKYLEKYETKESKKV